MIGVDMAAHNKDYSVIRTYITTTAGLVACTDSLSISFKEAEKKVKAFAKQLKKSEKKEKPVDFNKFLRQLCKRRKTCL